jgi:hypothetical protein
MPLIIGGMIAVSYWVYNEHGFFSQLLLATYNLLINRSVVVSGSSGPTTVFALGVEVSEQSVRQALISIATPNGIYFVVLLAVFSLGIAELLRFNKQHRRIGGLLLVGIAGSLLILKSPVALAIRLGHPFTLFFSTVLAVGFSRLISNERYKRIFPIFVIVILGTTAPIVAGGDLDSFHQGPDFYGSKNVPDPQREFPKSEYEGMRVTGNFLEKSNGHATTMWMSAVAFGQLDAPVRGGARVSDCAIRTSTDILFYRTKWTEHLVSFNGASDKMIISEESLGRMVMASNQVHTTGMTGLLLSNKESSFDTGCA